MARPTPEEIEEFNARMNEPDNNPDDDFEIEIFTPEGHGARLPYSRGKSYLQEHFGIDIGDPPSDPNAGNPANGAAANGEDPLNSPNAPRPSTSSRYFGKRGTQQGNPTQQSGGR
ncbi:MAG TPA: hypothetical protein VF733_04035 [Candidatus Saccharimonadales bacterium]